MLIGGLQKFSLLDYPGKISAIIFTQGCNFRCQFCYNPRLVWPIRPAIVPSSGTLAGEGGKLKYARGQSGEWQKVHFGYSQDELFAFLKSRLGKLDAVVITGGEPCLQKDLPGFVKKIKALGYLVKLDTNGSRPDVLAKLIKEKLVDYLAMDLKAPAKKYEEVTGEQIDFNKIRESVKLIKESGLPYEFRTTVVPDLLDRDDIGQMGKIIRGAGLWYLQNFKSQSEMIIQELKGKVPYNTRQMKEMAEIGRKYVKKCEAR